MDNNFTEQEKTTKKLVQARLPFKVLSTVEKNKLVVNSGGKLKSKDLNSVTESEVDVKDSEVDSKLNNDEIIILSEEDEDNERNKDSEKCENNTKSKTPDTKPKVFIKLPLSSKKKRKSSASNCSFDEEKKSIQDKAEKHSPKVESNPHKKVKISDSIAKPVYDSTPIINCKSSNSTEFNSNNNEPTSNLICDNSKTPEAMEINSSNELQKVEQSPCVLNNSTNLEEKIPIPESDNFNENAQDKEKELKCEATSADCEDVNLGKEKNKSDVGLLSDKNNESFETSMMDTTTLEESELESSSSQETNEDKDLIPDTKTLKDQNVESDTNTKKLNVSKQNSIARSSRSEQKRKEKEQKRNQERMEREEKRRKEKEEKEKKRLAEIEAKNEEKRVKEEEKRLKEEEKRKREEMKEEDRKRKEEEKRKKEELREEERKKREEEKRKKEMEKEEIENKKRKAAEVFTKFFVPRSKGVEDGNLSFTEKKENVNFMPFQIKDDMKLAPITRTQLNVEQKNVIDEFLQNDKDIPYSELYTGKLKSGNYNPMKSERTFPKMEDDDDIIIIDEMHGITQYLDETSKSLKKYKAKFLLFRENRRPPYYGTWRKKSSTITPRKPFGIDKQIFDYEIDSDLEWEEEEPGESLSCSDDEKESEDDYEVDNEFFVPHGHLSDEEMEEEDKSPEVLKAKLKILQQEFACEMKKKTEKIKPRLIGVVWSNKDSTKPETCPNIVWEFLKQQEMIFKDKVSISIQKDNSGETSSPVQQEKQKLNKRSELPEEFTAPLIKLVHGNTNNKLFIIKEFQAHLSRLDSNSENMHFTKSCIKEKIEKMAQWKVMKNKNLNKNFLCWAVSDENLEKYGLADLDIENKWKYIIPPKNKREIVETEEIKTPKPINKSNENTSVITKFTKILTKEEKEESLSNNKDKNIKSLKKSSPTIGKIDGSKVTDEIKPNAMKKRVPILYSVPRGQNVPEASKKIVVDDYLKQQNKSSTSLPHSTINVPENDDCIVLE
ncbi:chromatin assembly factor 1 subunit A-like [Condylostylus longicornis]|uniref:chromatin assembly factor 1 subunit A-like n=1 Tax=Condylostylus longicornis TaxID=2530218 RepID=UPI00244E4F22|nr:chromatin assembly factor 1 subunit A-like [Condylostylus longicornis]